MKLTEYKQQRQSLKISQQAVANAIKCHVQTISQIERGLMKEGSRTVKDYKEYIMKKVVDL